jgi:hypothetical protein
MMSYKYSLGGDKKCKQNFGGKTPWKVTIWKIKEENMHLRIVGCEEREFMALSNGRLWY